MATVPGQGPSHVPVLKENPKEAPRWELLQDHYLNDQHLAAGTLVGGGTQVPFSDPPSMYMRPVNPAAEREWEKHYPLPPKDPVTTLAI